MLEKPTEKNRPRILPAVDELGDDAMIGFDVEAEFACRGLRLVMEMRKASCQLDSVCRLLSMFCQLRHGGRARILRKDPTCLPVSLKSSNRKEAFAPPPISYTPQAWGFSAKAGETA